MDENKILESLSPNERKVLPFIEERNLIEICKKSNLDKAAVMRSLEYLQNKDIVKIESEKKKTIDLGVNGILYKKKGLPERRLLNLLSQNHIISLKDAQKESKLSDEEFKISLGALKKKAIIEIKSGKIFLNSKEEISKKTIEEIFIDSLPIEYEALLPEQEFALKSLQSRKKIIEIEDKTNVKVKPTALGKKLASKKLRTKDLIEQVTPDLLKSEKNWKGKRFRRYDVTSPVPQIYGGKRHFVNQAIDYARKVWTDMGFKEMTGDFVQKSFWNFDALFQPQDHPAREMQDTFFINKIGDLPDAKIVEAVKQSHEKGVDGSKGWEYKWSEAEAKRLVLRTHTTGVSAKTMAELDEKDLPAKFFIIGKNFRNETIDWSHGFEFNQTDGIVIDPKGNFRSLLGYLQQFFNKMGFPKVRFNPAYFPYTEPSVEIHVWHPERKVWLEIGGAGMFRPEMTIPLLGKHIPVMAWGPGFDRLLMDYYEIKDLRELYKNDITKLRKMKFWVKE